MMKFKTIKYSAIIKWLIPSLGGVLGLCSYFGNWWNTINADVEATINAQQIKANDIRTIAVCIANEGEDIDWSEVQIVPSFYNPTTYEVKGLRVQYELTGTGIEFEPTDFFNKSRFSRSKIIYKYKEHDLPSGELIPSPFYSYVINGEYARCKVKSKEIHEGSDAFEYQTILHFLVVENEGNLSFNDWIIECRSRLGKILPNQLYDVYFIDSNHNVKHDFAYAIKNGSNVLSYNNNQKHSVLKDSLYSNESLPYVSSRDSANHQIHKTTNTFPNNIGNVDLRGFMHTKKGSRSYLRLNMSQITSVDSLYYFVNSKFETDSIRGNGTSTLYMQYSGIFNDQVVLPTKVDTDIIHHISIKNDNNGKLVMSCDDNVIVIYRIADSEIRTNVFRKRHSNKIILKEKGTPSDICILNTLRYEPSFFTVYKREIMSVIFFLCMIFFGIIFIIVTNKYNE